MSYLHGLITKVETLNTLAQINLGKNAKVRKGMKFIVYRGDLLLGYLKIVSLNDDSAAGIVTARARTIRIAPGDKVRWRIEQKGFEHEGALRSLKNQRAQLETELHDGKRLTEDRKDQLQYQLEQLIEEEKYLTERIKSREAYLKREEKKKTDTSKR